MLQDLKLIREANVNFIRTSHYQAHPRFIELCDSLGFYVMEEVPFGFGDEHLTDKSYLPILKSRAKATLERDKNHPSIIVWSVGNENPLTDICLETGEYVKQLDPTRPHCFPQIGSYFRKIYEKIPESVDILSPHYPVPSILKEYSYKFNRPMIVTEYAHDGRSLAMAVSVNNRKPLFVDVNQSKEEVKWIKNIMRGYSEETIPVSIDKSGENKIRIYLLDTGLALNRIDVFKTK